MAAYRNCGQKSFRYVGNDDSNKKDDSIEPEVSKDEGDDKEGNSQKDGHARDDVNKMADLFGDRCLAHFEARGEVGDSAHDSVITSPDHQSATCPCGCGQPTWDMIRVWNLCVYDTMLVDTMLYDTVLYDASPIQLYNSTWNFKVHGLSAWQWYGKNANIIILKKQKYSARRISMFFLRGK